MAEVAKPSKPTQINFFMITILPQTPNLETPHHQRGTHYGRSGGKNQINRAQSRVKSGMRAAESGEEQAAEKTSASPGGRSHAGEAAKANWPRLSWIDGVGTAGGVAESTGFDCVTQQLRWQEQQFEFAGDSALTGGTAT